MSSIAARATTVSVVAAFALGGMLLAPSAALAQPVGSGGPKGCAVYHAETGTSEEVPDGTLIIGISGSVYQCKDGQWVKMAERVASKAQALAVTTSRATLR